MRPCAPPASCSASRASRRRATCPGESPRGSSASARPRGAATQMTPLSPVDPQHRGQRGVRGPRERARAAPASPRRRRPPARRGRARCRAGATATSRPSPAPSGDVEPRALGRRGTIGARPRRLGLRSWRAPRCARASARRGAGGAPRTHRPGASGDPPGAAARRRRRGPRSRRGGTRSAQGRARGVLPRDRSRGRARRR